MTTSKANVLINRIDIVEPGASPRSFKLTANVSVVTSAQPVIGFGLTTFLDGEESAALNALLDRAVERIKSNLRQGF
jgi:hypothetical protein